jgi:hypothetical protein
MKSKEPDNKSLNLIHSCHIVMGSLVFCYVLAKRMIVEQAFK